MAEFVMKDIVKKNGCEKEFIIDSAAVSTEEIGNDIYPNTKSLLYKKGIHMDAHRAHQITRAEFDDFDIILVMDQANISWLSWIVGEDNVYNSGKVHLLMEYASEITGTHQFDYPSVADPWYTRDFERSYQDILAGCTGLFNSLHKAE